MTGIMVRHMKPRCPHCDAEALYVGLERLDCPTDGCPNHRPEEDLQPLLPGLEASDFRFELLSEARFF